MYLMAMDDAVSIWHYGDISVGTIWGWLVNQVKRIFSCVVGILLLIEMLHEI